MSNRAFKIICFSVITLSMAIGYQNCGQGFKVAGIETITSECLGADCQEVIQTPTYNLYVADRNYIGNVLLSVYAGTPLNPALANIVNNHIKSMPEHLGGICTYSDGSRCRPDGISKFFSEPYHMAQVASASSPTKEGARIKTCMLLNNNDTALNFALSGAGFTGASPFDHANVSKLYKRFYQERTPSTEILDRLQTLGEKKSQSSTPLEGWRMISLALCMSSGWQLN